MQRSAQRTVWIMALVGLITLLAFGWWRGDSRTCRRLTVHLDQASELRPGDAVYLKGLHIGGVEEVRRQGRRTAIEVSILCEYVHLLNAATEFYLWRDERQPERKSLRAVPMESHLRSVETPRPLKPDKMQKNNP